jgi:hypothetical protein
MSRHQTTPRLDWPFIIANWQAVKSCARNPVARDLATGKYRQRVLADKRRKNSTRNAKRELRDAK